MADDSSTAFKPNNHDHNVRYDVADLCGRTQTANLRRDVNLGDQHVFLGL